MQREKGDNGKAFGHICLVFSYKSDIIIASRG